MPLLDTSSTSSRVAFSISPPPARTNRDTAQSPGLKLHEKVSRGCRWLLLAATFLLAIVALSGTYFLMLSPEEKGEFVDSINALTTIAFSFLQQQQGQAETHGQAEGHRQSTSKEGERRLSRKKEKKLKKRNLRQTGLIGSLRARKDFMLTSSSVTERLNKLEGFIFGKSGGDGTTVDRAEKQGELCPQGLLSAPDKCSVVDMFTTLEKQCHCKKPSAGMVDQPSEEVERVATRDMNARVRRVMKFAESVHKLIHSSGRMCAALTPLYQAASHYQTSDGNDSYREQLPELRERAEKAVQEGEVALREVHATGRNQLCGTEPNLGRDQPLCKRFDFDLVLGTPQPYEDCDPSTPLPEKPAIFDHDIICKSTKALAIVKPHASVERERFGGQNPILAGTQKERSPIVHGFCRDNRLLPYAEAVADQERFDVSKTTRLLMWNEKFITQEGEADSDSNKALRKAYTDFCEIFVFGKLQEPLDQKGAWCTELNTKLVADIVRETFSQSGASLPTREPETRLSFIEKSRKPQKEQHGGKTVDKAFTETEGVCPALADRVEELEEKVNKLEALAAAMGPVNKTREELV
ncbi:unnamed protein product [Amoebophrya sp. A25]|nr:unnamed protein product [Amoebophrya sp. A25]|eukprot:GSA25T00008850001.1